jgi:hypothetical protein
LWLPGPRCPAGRLRRPAAHPRRERAGQAAQSLPPPTPGRERVGGGRSATPRRATAAVGGAPPEAAAPGRAPRRPQAREPLLGLPLAQAAEAPVPPLAGAFCGKFLINDGTTAYKR